MTVLEKAVILSGKNSWETHEIPALNIPSITFSDGPNGVRKQAGKGDHLGLNDSLPSTCFPTLATLANSWNTELSFEVGKALGQEAKALGVNVLLAPGLNIKRSPLCGRNFEYFSEDPYLSGKMAAAFVRGVQSQKVFACPKHFAVNNQENQRMAKNSVVDERALREIYLTAFEIAIKEGNAHCIMTSYNEVNGVYANENAHLLRDILRGEWKYKGMVVTDWGGSNDHISGVKAGSTVEMPCPGFDSARALLEGLKIGKIIEEEIDERVEELLHAIYHLTDFKNKEEKSTSPKLSKELINSHNELAGKVLEESIVLLKNKDNILPLKKETKVAVIGDFAILPRYQGAGSSKVNATKLESIKDVVYNYFPECTGIKRGYQRCSLVDVNNENEALKLAEKSDVLLYFFGLDESSEIEGMDRKTLGIPENQISLLNKLFMTNKPVVGILSAGSAVKMPWLDKCQGLIHTYLGGQNSAKAILKVLCGQINPSGKLNESYAKRYCDSPAASYWHAKGRDCEYKESIFVGYRYYDRAKKDLLFPFGFGLSYTEFEYSNLKISHDKVSFTLTNTGKYSGAEISQLYIGLSDSEIFRPLKELKGFSKVFLEAGQSKTVTIKLDDKAFRYWNSATSSWEIEEGYYQFYIGASVEDIRLSALYYVKGTSQTFPEKNPTLLPYYKAHIKKISDKSFNALMTRENGKGIVINKKHNHKKHRRKLDINDALSQMDKAQSVYARMFHRFLVNKMIKAQRNNNPDLNTLFIYNMPFRAMAKMSGGAIDMNMAHAILEVVNGNLFKGSFRLIKEHLKNHKKNKKVERLLKKRK
ncbi:beta-glucosidase [Acetitomaculum ruminis]